MRQLDYELNRRRIKNKTTGGAKFLENSLSKSEYEVLIGILSSKGHEISCREESVYNELAGKGMIKNNEITKDGLAALEPYRVRKAVVLAAGFGSRMAPITINTPKPLVRVHGQRIIDGLLDACVKAEIEEIYIVRGYLGEQFDQLLYKYPAIKFIDNRLYNTENNISSAMLARNLLSDAYVMEADLYISNPDIISKYQYRSNFLAIKTEKTDDWCFEAEDGFITKEKVGGENCWQMVGISYWSAEDGKKLAQDISSVYSEPNGKQRYWEQVPLEFRREHYHVAIRECGETDIIEIDTIDELKAIDPSYDV